MNKVESFRITPKAREYAKGVNRMARLQMLLRAKQKKLSQEAMMLQELADTQGQALGRALKEAPRDLVHELEDEQLAGEM